MYLKFKLSNGQVVEGNVDKNPVTIGRSNKADFVVPDEALSRQHCLIELNEGTFYITDLGSANGVFLDGNRIPSDQKTTFTTFMQLALGPLEFSVEDEAGETSAPQYRDQSDANNATAVTRVISKNQSKKHFDKRRDSAQSKKDKTAIDPKLMGAFLLVALLAVGYYFGMSEGEEIAEGSQELSAESTGPVIQKVERLKFSTPPEFSSEDYYQNIETKKTCTGFSDLCEEFKLSEAENEGVYQEKKELYIFLNPTSFYDIQQLSFLRGKEESADVLSHYLVLKSSLFEKFERRELEQIHLLQLDINKKVSQIYRYHINQFNDSNDLRFRLVGLINNAFANQDLKDIAKDLKDNIPHLRPMIAAPALPETNPDSANP